MNGAGKVPWQASHHSSFKMTSPLAPRKVEWCSLLEYFRKSQSKKVAIYFLQKMRLFNNDRGCYLFVSAFQEGQG